jgi:hypothetical protein
VVPGYGADTPICHCLSLLSGAARVLLNDGITAVSRAPCRQSASERHHVDLPVHQFCVEPGLFDDFEDALKHPRRMGNIVADHC